MSLFLSFGFVFLFFFFLVKHLKRCVDFCDFPAAGTRLSAASKLSKRAPGHGLDLWVNPAPTPQGEELAAQQGAFLLFIRLLKQSGLRYSSEHIFGIL
jgi:hypothetical protein